jgi:NAD(P)-dependent dehydrogenase (short-subunit alcohol dehydrogenase family)
MAGRLDGKVALITGGGSGIGRACAVRFAAEGAVVCAADLNLEGAAETVRQVEAAGGKALAVQVDTTDEAACEAMVARSVEAFGAVDVLVAAAGISGIPAGASLPAQPPPYPTLVIPTEMYKRVIGVKFYGVLFSDQAAARWMVANRRPGAIINLASIMAKLLESREKSRENFAAVLESGVKWALGTDSMHGLMWWEIAKVVEWGADPYDALRAATHRAAQAIGLSDQVGTLEPGKLADVISVDGDPLTDVACLQRVSLIVQAGRRRDTLSPD